MVEGKVHEEARIEGAASIEKISPSSSPGPDTQSQPGEATTIDPQAEARLVRKLDWALMPLFTTIYCLNFIDRTSIGNARVAGLEKDLGMSGNDLNIALTIFYVFYIVADIPSNLLLKQFGSAWLAFLVVGFGVVSIGSAFLKNFTGLILSRVFLGLTEGGTLSALLYIVSRYYRKHEFVLRVSIFFGIGPSISGAFGGLLASGLLKLPDFGIITTWRKIFFIEGLITTIFGVALFFLAPEDPSKSRLLSDDERKLAISRIDADLVIRSDGVKEKTSWALIKRSFNLLTVSCILNFIMISMSFQGLGLFLPSVVRTLGKYSVIEVQLRSVPPYVVSAVWVVANAYLSSRIRLRYLPLLYNIILAVIGYAMSIATKNPRVRYAACFLNIMAGSVVGPMLVIWGTDNAAPDTMRVVVTAAIPGIGALGSVMAVWTYMASDAPDYRRGNTGNLATTTTITVLVALTALYLRRENAKRERGERDHRLEGKTEDEIKNLGYLHPQFRYQI